MRQRLGAVEHVHAPLCLFPMHGEVELVRVFHGCLELEGLHAIPLLAVVASAEHCQGRQPAKEGGTAPEKGRLLHWSRASTERKGGACDDCKRSGALELSPVVQVPSRQITPMTIIEIYNSSTVVVVPYDTTYSCAAHELTNVFALQLSTAGILCRNLGSPGCVVSSAS